MNKKFFRYPKKRPPLPEEFERKFNELFLVNRKGNSKASSLSKKMEEWMHKKVSDDIKLTKDTISTLEIGAGTLNHLKFEKNAKPYDIIEPYRQLFEDSKHLKRVRWIYSDIFEIPKSKKYFRIVSIAVLEHILNLPDVVAKAGLHLEEEGCFRVGIPSEGEPLWKLGWKLTTGLEIKLRYGLDWGEYLKHEHVNTSSEIEEILGYFFETINRKILVSQENFRFISFLSVLCHILIGVRII